MSENDQPNHQEKQARNAFWMVLTALSVAISLSLLMDITKRFLSGGAGWLSIINSIVQPSLIFIQAGLGLLAAGTLTEPGREWANRLLVQLGLFNNYKARKRFFVSVMVFVLLLGISLSLPAIANDFVRSGNYFVENDPVQATRYYQRALNLNPDNAEAHFGLGIAYENSNDTDNAIAEYLNAINKKSGYLEAHNNLARLYINRGIHTKGTSDFKNARLHVDIAIELSPANAEIGYVLYKNRGWVKYELARLDSEKKEVLLPSAEQDLITAIELDQTGRDTMDYRAEAHCLLAFVLEEMKRKTEALPEWRDCLAYSSKTYPREYINPEWLDIARSRVSNDAAVR